MRWLRSILRELIGLFVDDGSLALLVLLWCGVALFLLPHIGLSPMWAGVALFVGLACILATSALRYK